MSSVPSPDTPTAVQARADPHDTPRSSLYGERGVGWTTQREPFQRSTSVNQTPDLFAEPPTAVHAVCAVHETASRTASIEPAGFAARTTDQFEPFQCVVRAASTPVRSTTKPTATRARLRDARDAVEKAQDRPSRPGR